MLSLIIGMMIAINGFIYLTLGELERGVFLSNGITNYLMFEVRTFHRKS